MISIFYTKIILLNDYNMMNVFLENCLSFILKLYIYSMSVYTISFKILCDIFLSQ